MLVPLEPGGWYQFWSTNLRKVEESWEPVQRTVTTTVTEGQLARDMETRRIYSRGYNWYLKYLEPCQVQEKTVLFSLHDYRRVGTRGKWFQFTFRKNFLRRRTLQRWGGPEGTYNPQLDMNELRLVWGYRGQRFYNGKSGIGREIRLDSFSGLVQLCDSWGSMLVTD